MKCPHANDCALFPVFTQASFLKIWQASYCDGDYARCARYVAVKAGERVLILGAPGTGKTQLFRALAGLWPWGSGQITRPQGEHIFYLPRGTPYLPRGTLQ